MISLSVLSSVMSHQDTAVPGASLGTWNISLHTGLSCLNACGKTHFFPSSDDTNSWRELIAAVPWPCVVAGASETRVALVSSFR